MILQHRNRVIFDPSNQEHRMAVRDFLTRRSWSDVDIRFAEDSSYTNIATQVQEKLLNWYLSKEEDI